jgi:nicotinate-nucleotide--dimethylbenzimidazole phosphoribosyltransferase
MTETELSGNPFDDVRALVETMPDLDDAKIQDICEEAVSLGRGLRPIGRLTAPLSLVAAWQDTPSPQLARPLITVFVGTHGIAEQLAYGDIIAASKARVASLTEGQAAVRGIAGELGAAYKVYEFGLDYPSADFTKEESLSERDCAAAIAFGMEVVAEGADVIVLGAAGLGAATAAAAINISLYGGAANYWAGGEGAEDRIKIVAKGLSTHSGKTSDPLEVLRIFGGREIAGLIGAILAARHQHIPVLLDGYVSCTAAAILHSIDPATIDHCIASHISAEPAHDALLSRLGLSPVVNLDINIGDGTGGALALAILKAASAGLMSLKV